MWTSFLHFAGMLFQADSTGGNAGGDSGNPPGDQSGSGSQSRDASRDTTQQQTQNQEQVTQLTQGGKSWTLPEALQEIGKIRGEAANHRTRATAAETERDQLRQAVAALTSERDGLASERNQLLETKRAGEVLALATQAAQEAKALQPASVAKLIRLSDVEWDDKGQPKNLKTLIEAIQGNFPQLFRAGGADGGTRERETGEGDPGFGPKRMAYAYGQSGAGRRQRRE